MLKANVKENKSEPTPRELRPSLRILQPRGVKPTPRSRTSFPAVGENVETCEEDEEGRRAKSLTHPLSFCLGPCGRAIRLSLGWRYMSGLTAEPEFRLSSKSALRVCQRFHTKPPTERRNPYRTTASAAVTYCSTPTSVLSPGASTQQ